MFFLTEVNAETLKKMAVPSNADIKNTQQLIQG